MKQRRLLAYWGIGSLILATLTAAEILHGPTAPESSVIWLLRVPRAITALIAGAALAVSGAQMQSIFRNPLADPHILGVSAGAALGAAVATMHPGAAGISVAISAFIGALVAASVILAVSRKFSSAATLLIFGVMSGFITNALVTILQFSTDSERLRIFYSWSAGNFSTSTWQEIGIMVIALVCGGAMAFRERKGADIMLFGDEFASMAGADIGSIRLRILVSCCIMTGAVTAFCGPIGFIGITAPHIARALCRTSANRIVLPASILSGCAISLTADLASQIAPAPIPVSSTMALIGIPVIIYMLLKRPAFSLAEEGGER